MEENSKTEKEGFYLSTESSQQPSLTIDDVKILIEEAVKELEKKIAVSQFVFSKDEPGIWHIEIPEKAENILISASAGGASGQGIVDYSHYGADGENTIIEIYNKENVLTDTIELEGGFAGTVAPIGGMSSANGNSSSFGKGGIVRTSDDAGEDSGQSRGAGGASSGYMDYEAWGGDAGEEIVSYKAKEKPKKIMVSIGKGGDINTLDIPDEDSSSIKTVPGNGANGFVEVSYIIGTLRGFEEEGVSDFFKGGE